MSCNCEKELESKFSADQVDLSLMEKVFERYFNENGNLISILQDAQGVYGYLPLDVLKLISDKTGKKKAQIYGVATFYSQFRLNKLGKYIIMQCQGTACHVNGSEAVGQAICDELGIKPGETSSDGMFSLEDVACLGCCSLAPVIMINGETYANLTPDKARKVIQDIYAKEKEEAV
ncbi:complex I 24 kDa subunit family protein [Clostridium magnum]|uniref:NADP-reducing hydrogenase subunit HndA n=1 Tax=Clostridium magnum DSM 2767 TaxID=1121326 RepID=A0A161WQ71_9CLOT|nr:NAD(P)H-dependent oxidoreductase subunit E [Clostridium magnum]KZL88768.1 NADP-reducing hydrogenase subunit HndA [Clostridium magnum DSM 2767]SHJ51102.1 NADH dehydrogenase subunit E [Clostridium magnum DSM 2767]